MAKANLSELEAALNNGIYDRLITDKDDANNMSQSIENFIANSPSQLQGPNWDQVRVKMDQYKIALDARVSAGGMLFDAINDAIKQLKEAMGKYDDIDTSKLETYRGIVAGLEADRDAVYITKEESFTYKDEKGNFHSGTHSVYDKEATEAKKAEYQAKIDEYNELIATTENFLEVSAKVERELADIFSQVSSMCQNFTRIEPTPSADKTMPPIG